MSVERCDTQVKHWLYLCISEAVYHSSISGNYARIFQSPYDAVEQTVVQSICPELGLNIVHHYYQPAGHTHIFNTT